jgi:AcrR family transcriptional regulator
MPTRRYDQRRRAETAEQTRRRILDAVEQRLREGPDRAISVDEVARLAGVARSTVYLIFESRAGLFDAVADDLLERGGFDEVLRAIEHPDARETVRGGIRGGVRTFAAHRDEFRVLYSMAQLDPEAVAGAMHRGEQKRSRAMDELAGRLAEQGVLRDGISRRQAAGLLFVLTSFESFDLLFDGRGLSARSTADVLVETAERALF